MRSTHADHQAGPSNEAPRTREHRHGEWSNEGMAAAVFLLRFSRPGVDRLVAPLGINKSLAFTTFDKTIIFEHWLSKTQKLASAPEAFLLRKGFYYILVDYFQES